MATITIYDLHPVGMELFATSENFMSELVDAEFNSIKGGIAFEASTYVCSNCISHTIMNSPFCTQNQTVNEF